VFGKLVGGEDVLNTIEKMPVKPGTERPSKPIRITEIIMFVLHCSSSLLFVNTHHISYQDPFEEYRKRHEKKLARQAAAEANGIGNGEQDSKQQKDHVNWFGLKVGSNSAAFGTGESGVGGVGKYLSFSGSTTGNLKRPQAFVSSTSNDSGSVLEESKKKRKLGFGDFESW